MDVGLSGESVSFSSNDLTVLDPCPKKEKTMTCTRETVALDVRSLSKPEITAI